SCDNPPSKFFCWHCISPGPDRNARKNAAPGENDYSITPGRGRYRFSARRIEYSPQPMNTGRRPKRTESAKNARKSKTSADAASFAANADTILTQTAETAAPIRSLKLILSNELVLNVFRSGPENTLVMGENTLFTFSPITLR